MIQKALASFDIAIMLLAADDIVECRDQEFMMTRDNVLLEAGAFAQKCGIENVLLLIPKEANYKLPSDFLGLNCIVFDYARGADNAVAYKRITEKLISFSINNTTVTNNAFDFSSKNKNPVEKDKKPGGKLI